MPLAKTTMAVNELNNFVLNRPSVVHKRPGNVYCRYMNVYTFVHDNIKRADAVSAGQEAWSILKKLSAPEKNAGIAEIYALGTAKMERIRSKKKPSILDFFKKVGLRSYT